MLDVSFLLRLLMIERLRIFLLSKIVLDRQDYCLFILELSKVFYPNGNLFTNFSYKSRTGHSVQEVLFNKL